MKQQFKWDWVSLILIVLLSISVLFELEQIFKWINWIIFIILICVIFYRRSFDWKNVPIAFIIVFSILPIRIIYGWQWSVFIYAIPAAICIILICRHQPHGGNRVLIPTLIFCFGLCIWQLAEIQVEMGKCHKNVEISPIPIDYSCGGTGRMYVRIQSTPIGISYPCYSCW